MNELRKLLNGNPRAWNRIRAKIGLRPRCPRGWRVPDSCGAPADVRVRISDRFEWSYYCSEHLGWPYHDHEDLVDWDVEPLPRGDWDGTVALKPSDPTSPIPGGRERLDALKNDY